MSSPKDPCPGLPVGQARSVCATCLKGSGWNTIYKHSPTDLSQDKGRMCASCGRPEILLRVKRQLKSERIEAEETLEEFPTPPIEEAN